jgi:hypothetical protein
MPVIKIHLEYAEYNAIERLAGLIDVAVEDVAFAGLNRLMLVARDREVQNDIVLTRRWRQDNLPLWSDTAGSVHNYEGMSPCEPEKSKYSV